MNQLRVLSLTTLMLMPASRLPAQTPANGEDLNAQVVACNEGTITFNVARAYRSMNFFSGYEWQFEGWYVVDPGKCEEIGSQVPYHNGGIIRKDSFTLLAITFYDSTGTWGAIRRGSFSDGRLGQPSNQQFCVKGRDPFGYTRDSPGGDLPRECDGAQTGYQMIPAALEYDGPLGLSRLGYDAANKFYLKLDSSDRAIPLGKQTSSGGASQSSSGAGTSKSDGGASPSMCGKVSCWDLVVQRLNQAVKDDEAQKAAANTRNNPPAPQPPANNLPTPPQPAPAGDPIGGGGFITPPTSFNALMCQPADLGRNSSWRPGSKMAAFQDMAARYIASVAKPGWQYWISQAQYERFDPATTMSGDQFMSAVSPDSGRFDPFDPKCPSGYEGFWLPVRH